jgi:hypothetical protein
MERLIKIAIAVIACSVLSACATTSPKIVYVDKPTPVIVTPEPPVLLRPGLEVNNLTTSQKESDGEIAKAYVISVDQLIEYSSILEEIIEQYRKLSKLTTEQREKLDKAILKNIEVSGGTKTYTTALSEELEKIK